MPGEVPGWKSSGVYPPRTSDPSHALLPDPQQGTTHLSPGTARTDKRQIKEQQHGQEHRRVVKP